MQDSNKLFDIIITPIIHYHTNGNKKQESYYYNKKLHNENGPAYICYDENGEVILQEYYLGGNLLSKENWLESYLIR